MILDSLVMEDVNRLYTVIPPTRAAYAVAIGYNPWKQLIRPAYTARNYILY